MSENFFLKEYRLLTPKEKENFFNFCRESSKEFGQPAAKNMWARNTFVKPWTLGYRLEQSEDFIHPHGNFYVLFEDQNVVACSGVYKSDFDDGIYIASVRSWIHPEYRNKLINKRFFLPEEKRWAVSMGAKIIALSFNDYNKNIIEIFRRNRLGETNSRIGKRLPQDLFYNNFNVLEFPVIIRGTKQWVCYETIDVDYEFDWQSIRLTAENKINLGYQYQPKEKNSIDL